MITWDGRGRKSAEVDERRNEWLDRFPGCEPVDPDEFRSGHLYGSREIDFAFLGRDFQGAFARFSFHEDGIVVHVPLGEFGDEPAAAMIFRPWVVDIAHEGHRAVDVEVDQDMSDVLLERLEWLRESQFAYEESLGAWFYGRCSDRSLKASG